MKRTLSLILVGVMLIFAVAGCGSTPAPEGSSNDEGEAPKGPQLSMIRIGTASMTGNSYVQGSAIAQMITEKVEGINSAAQATGGSGDNCYLLDEDEIELGFIQSATAKQAVTGTGSFDGQKIESLRGVGVVVVNAFHIIVNTKSGIEKPSDLRGKKVGVATMGGGVEVNANIVLGEFGIAEDEYEHIYSTMGEALEMVKLGQVDAVIYATSIGNANVYDTLSNGTCTLLSLPQEEIDRITSKRDEFGPSVIPGGSYPDVPDDVLAISGSMLLLTRENIDEETIYTVTKGLFENNDYLVAQNASLADTIPENAMVGMCVPLHPGAERYLKEIGALE
ncbi:MAG: TAXI family TRAP transporter solute-binding subunit [Clostridia bacterium]|nr:TAXI family TRAP transporter solute-binding subunit [Clostridiales bacterium]